VADQSEPSAAACIGLRAFLSYLRLGKTGDFKRYMKTNTS